jgi:hypothetical protein
LNLRPSGYEPVYQHFYRRRPDELRLLADESVVVFGIFLGWPIGFSSCINPRITLRMARPRNSGATGAMDWMVGHGTGPGSGPEALQRRGGAMTEQTADTGGTGTEEGARLPETAGASGSPVMSLLLEEYRTLREEVISRMAGRVQLLAFTIAGAGLAANARSPVYAGIAGALVAVGIAFWTSSKRGIERAADQIAGLERRINTLSNVAGPDSGLAPLSWETQQTQIRTGARWLRRWL